MSARRVASVGKSAMESPPKKSINQYLIELVDLLDKLIEELEQARAEARSRRESKPPDSLLQ